MTMVSSSAPLLLLDEDARRKTDHGEHHASGFLIRVREWFFHHRRAHRFDASRATHSGVFRPRRRLISGPGRA
jgi:hypothetical protein